MAARRSRRSLANLFIAGAPKCGTTAWVRYLGSHPDIYFAEMKEPNYFLTDFPRMRWISTREEYDELFARAGGARAVGEASAMYLYSATAAEKIRGYNPDARILIFLREREKFLPALHHHLLSRFVEGEEDFEVAWRMSGKRPPNTIPKTCRDPKLLDYASFGRFGEQLARFFATFPRNQILVIDFNSWTADPRATYLRILEFLGLPDDGRTDFPQVNEAKSFRNAWVGRLITHPPRFARAAVNLLRRVTGRSALGIGTRAADLLSAKGYRTSVRPEILEEIRHYYAEDERLLRSLLPK